MGRPAKSVKVATGARSAEEVAIRKEIEERLRNAAKKVTPDVMDEVYKRIGTGDGSDNIVPMDLSARRNRRKATDIR